jgi:hypothetical protein
MDDAVVHAAEQYADVLNRAGPAGVDAFFDDAPLEPWFDERTNLFSMAAESPTDYALVLADPPGSEEYVIVRWDGEWFVDTTPVDWAEVEAAAFADDE